MLRRARRLSIIGALLVALAAPGITNAASPLDGLTIPTADPSLAYVAPTPDQPDYDARVAVFVQTMVPDSWGGQPVDFLTTLNDTGVDVLGLPTSAPAADPNNPNFIYQRFQNGVLFYNGSDGTTTVLPLS